MSQDTHQPVPSMTDLTAMVATEVERQIGALKADFSKAIDEVRERTVDNRCTIVVFSGDLDKVIASFVIATGAAAVLHHHALLERGREMFGDHPCPHVRRAARGKGHDDANGF